MRALVYTQPNEVQLQDRPEPVLAAEEVILKIDAVGICGSDMHAYHGHDPRRKPGLVLGHEFSGTVVQSASARYSMGTRVTGNPLITCGTCDYCVQGRNNLCAHRTMVGMTRPGAIADYMSIPAASLIDMPQSQNVVKSFVGTGSGFGSYGPGIPSSSWTRLGSRTPSGMGSSLVRFFGVRVLAIGHLRGWE